MPLRALISLRPLYIYIVYPQHSSYWAVEIDQFFSILVSTNYKPFFCFLRTSSLQIFKNIVYFAKILPFTTYGTGI
jgi:hypothetical protein